MRGWIRKMLLYWRRIKSIHWMKKKYWIIGILLLAIVALPFFVRKGESEVVRDSGEKIIIITPHNEAVKYEFGIGFKDWYFRKTGKKVWIDWRTLGSGSSDNIKFIDSRYNAAFKDYWQKVLKREWTQSIQEAFSKREDHERYPEGDLVNQVYTAFVNSNVGCDMDIFFGGGDLDLIAQAKKGQLALLNIFEMHPEWFQEEVIPERLQWGGLLRDPGQKWIGTALSGFDLIYNRDVLKKLRIQDITQLDWPDLADERFFGTIALADPTVSGSFTRAFEVILQYYMQKVYNVLKESGESEEESRQRAIAEGWYKGMQLIQNIAANARYFTDSSIKAIMDVASGNCAIAMTIDFYGVIQIENLKKRDGVDRLGLLIPKGGTAVSPDPIAIFKGAPHTELALAFVEYVLSVDGQELWDFKVGAPGGPKRYPLGRASINKKLYSEEYLPYRTNSELNYYANKSPLEYRPQWTAPLLKQMRFVIKVSCIDTHPELVTAWKAIIQARKENRWEDAAKAFEVMQDLHAVDYAQITGSIQKTLDDGGRLDRVKLQGSLSKYFNDQYQLAEKIAKGEGNI